MEVKCSLFKIKKVKCLLLKIISVKSFEMGISCNNSHIANFSVKILTCQCLKSVALPSSQSNHWLLQIDFVEFCIKFFELNCIGCSFEN